MGELLIIFKRFDNLTQPRDFKRRATEYHHYDSRVTFIFTPMAYSKKNVFLIWKTHVLVPNLPTGLRFLAIDVAKFHY